MKKLLIRMFYRFNIILFIKIRNNVKTTFRLLTRRSELKFIPRDEWKSTLFSIEELKKKYFARRNGPARHFNYKLTNALKITRRFPQYYLFIGVIQIRNNLIKVNSTTFGTLLGIRAIQGGLFHKQGNFHRNGFQQVPKKEVDRITLEVDIDDVDDNEVRIYTIPEQIPYLPLP